MSARVSNIGGFDGLRSSNCNVWLVLQMQFGDACSLESMVASGPHLEVTI